MGAVIDERASATHARPYASIPLGRDPEEGYRDISYGLFANSINSCAHWICATVPYSEEPLVYAGPLDLTYQILCMAAVKAGRVVRVMLRGSTTVTNAFKDVFSFPPQQYRIPSRPA